MGAFIGPRGGDFGIDLESFQRLRQGTNVPVATGEHFYNRWEVEQFLEADALHYVQADPEWCGGISEV